MKKNIKLKKNITLDDLAGMMESGFIRVEKNTDKKIDDLAQMTAKGFEETAKEKEVNLRFYEVNERLDRIEKILFWDYKNRIEKLEDQVKELQADYRQLLGAKR